MNAVLDDLLVAVATVGLPGSLLELPHHDLAEPQARDLVDAAARHELVGVMLASAQVGDLMLPPVAMDALVDMHVREMTTCQHLEHELLSATAQLDEAGIESRVLNGSATAHLDYQDPALRTFRNVDLLVRPADVDPAMGRLQHNGWRRPRPEPRTGFDRRSGNGATLLGPSGLRMDLHCSFALGPAGLDINIGELWADGQQFVVGDRWLTALGGEQRLLHACCHATVTDSPPRLVSQRDLVEMILFGSWNHARLMKLATSWRARGVLAHAVSAAWRRLAIADVTGLSVWAEAYRPPADRALLARRNSVAGTGQSLPAWPWRGVPNAVARRR